jgi:hypothetical protein
MSDAFRFLTDAEFHALTTEEKVHYIARAHEKLARMWKDIEPPQSMLLRFDSPPKDDTGGKA